MLKYNIAFDYMGLFKCNSFGLYVANYLWRQDIANINIFLNCDPHLNHCNR